MPRHSGGSSSGHGGGGHSTGHGGSSPSPRPGSSSSGGSSNGMKVETSALSSMAGKLSGLGSDLEGAGSKIGGAHPGGGAFGVVGQAFGGKLNSILGAAQEHVGGVAKGAHGAGQKMRATLADLQHNESRISSSFDRITDPASPPRTHNPGAVNRTRSGDPGGQVHPPPPRRPAPPPPRRGGRPQGTTPSAVPPMPTRPAPPPPRRGGRPPAGQGTNQPPPMPTRPPPPPPQTTTPSSAAPPPPPPPAPPVAGPAGKKPSKWGDPLNPTPELPPTEHPNIKPVAAFPNVDPNKMSPPPQWQNHDGKTPIYRFDNRPPTGGNNSPFDEGFKPKPDANPGGDLATYQANNQGSMYVGTTTNDNLGTGGKWSNMWRYTIHPPQGAYGVNVNQTLGDASAKPHENEIAFPGGIKPGYIHGAQWYEGGRPSGQYQPNPGYVPGGQYGG